MKLGSLQSGRDGKLIVFSRNGEKFADASDIAPNLLTAVEDWSKFEPLLKERFDQLEAGSVKGEPAAGANIASAFPRCPQFADGSAFIQHIVLVRKARNAEPPETLHTVPLMYQAISDYFLSPNEDIKQVDFAHGTDFEAEVGVVVDDVPCGVSPEDALKHIKLFVLINDVSLRGLIPGELKQGFGFFQSKPNSSLSPMAITADELGEAYREGRIHLPLNVEYNDNEFGRANAGEMHFHFGQLVAHAAKTRNLAAGTIIGSGTVANEDVSKGSSCLAEKRMLEKIDTGEFVTPFMKVGDTVEIKMLNEKGENLFGTIRQKVVQA